MRMKGKYYRQIVPYQVCIAVCNDSVVLPFVCTDPNVARYEENKERGADTTTETNNFVERMGGLFHQINRYGNTLE